MPCRHQCSLRSPQRRKFWVAPRQVKASMEPLLLPAAWPPLCFLAKQADCCPKSSSECA